MARTPFYCTGSITVLARTGSRSPPRKSWRLPSISRFQLVDDKYRLPCAHHLFAPISNIFCQIHEAVRPEGPGCGANRPSARSALGHGAPRGKQDEIELDV